MSTTTCSRTDYFNNFKLALDDYMNSLNYTAPEAREDSRRNPIVLMNDMAKKVPEGSQYDKFVQGFWSLAQEATAFNKNHIVKLWWQPVSEYKLGELIGELDADWKKQAIKIWFDPEYTKKTLE